MPHRIEIGLKKGIRDPLGEKVRRRIENDLGLAVESVRTISVFTLDIELSGEELEKVATGPFLDPIIQQCRIDQPLADDFDWLAEVGFKPGVTDNVGKTAREAIEWRLGKRLGDEEKVYTSTQYLLKGNLKREEVERICTDLLGNSLIQRFDLYKANEWNGKIKLRVPKVSGDEGGRVEEIDLEISDEALLRLSQERVLALNLREMKAIQAYLRDSGVMEGREKTGLGKKITDAELEAIAQTWSEHCKHKIFNGRIEYQEGEEKRTLVDSLFKTYIKKATEEIRSSLGEKDWCVSVFDDNAGVIRFNDQYHLVFKVETHNTPSALDPYGGALTGIVGVNRDPFGTGKGAKLIFNTDIFCFASPFYNKPLPPRLFHPKRIYEGVREGVEHGGNKSGIPTVNGGVVFDDRYLGKPLVYCGTGGIMPKEILGEPSHIKKAEPGDFIVMTGGRIGKDGIHGATFSSEELREDSPVTAVQIGDPITQKKMTDFLLLARDRGLYKSITDNGAGGLSSSVGEMARETGCELHLDRAPLKYHGLHPWEILLSEAQERMTLAVSPPKLDAFLEMAKKMDVEAAVLGTFTHTKKFHVLSGGKTVAYLDMDFLHEGLPVMELRAKWNRPRYEEPDFPEPGDLTSALMAMLSRPNIASKESIIRQYDHEVQGGAVIKPLVGCLNDGPGDAAVLRPILSSFEGIVISNGICPRYSDLDTYAMVACAVDEAIRNNVAVGGNPDRISGLDNFCWPDPVQSEKTPDGEYKLAQLVRANQALYDCCKGFGMPLISGKDSMKNDAFLGGTKISIPPTLLVSALGKIDDVRKAVTMDAKKPGDLIYLLGKTFEELGGSEYYASKGFIGNHVPQVNAQKAKALYRKLYRAIREGLVRSCHDCSDGGLGVALAETSFAGCLGMEIDLRKVPQSGVDRNDLLLFSESQSRFVVTIPPEKKKAFEALLGESVWREIGIVIANETFRVVGFQGSPIIEANIFDLKKAWQKPLKF
ncbi:MAG: phosphoribosylformylglycinamidine synthase II [Deltaproteobacteria bacterium RBG_16_49_23]|nr:MAG: phosphoribosylformylglycinamidine synthase II [Deltaproteobacteria bacterium RBG_16_49_23]